VNARAVVLVCALRCRIEKYARVHASVEERVVPLFGGNQNSDL